MESLFKVFLITHIVAGGVSFIVAPAALIVKKGAAAHALWGKIFFGCMTVVFLTALFLSTYHWTPFLLALAVFSYYNVISGYRSLYHKQLHNGRGLTWIDWVSMSVSLLFNFGFLVYGVYMFTIGYTGLGILSVVFALGGLLITGRNLQKFLKPPAEKNIWFFSHIGGMMGGFISAVTAFSAQTLTFLPGLVQWIWPSVIGTIIIFRYIAYYRRKLAEGYRLNELVELKH